MPWAAMVSWIFRLARSQLLTLRLMAFSDEQSAARGAPPTASCSCGRQRFLTSATSGHRPECSAGKDSARSAPCNRSNPCSSGWLPQLISMLGPARTRTASEHLEIIGRRAALSQRVRCVWFLAVTTSRPVEMGATRLAEGVTRRATLATEQHVLGIALELSRAKSRLAPRQHLLRLEAPRTRDRVTPVNVLVDDP